MALLAEEAVTAPLEAEAVKALLAEEAVTALLVEAVVMALLAEEGKAPPEAEEVLLTVLQQQAETHRGATGNFLLSRMKLKPNSYPVGTDSTIQPSNISTRYRRLLL